MGGARIDAASGEPLSLIFRLENRSEKQHVVTGELEIPEGWQQVIRPMPIVLDSRTTQTSLTSVAVPAAAEAGDYEVTYAASSRDGAASDTARVTVTVVERRALQVTAIDRPEFVATGEASTVRFRVANAGNRDSRIVLTVTCDRNVEAATEPADLLLGAGESAIVPVSFTTFGQGSGMVTLTASLEADPSVRSLSAATIQVVQRGNQRRGYHHMPAKLQLRLPGEGSEVRPQTVLSASGPIFDEGDERIDLYVRTPSQRSIGIFGAADHYRAAYHSKKYDVLLGDHVYRLSPLTTSGGSFFGAMTSARFGDTEVGAVVNRSRWQFYDQAQQGVYVKHGDPKSSHTSYQALNRVGADAGQIVSAKGIFRDYPMLHADAEVGVGQRGAEKSAAWQVRFSGTSEDVRYTIQHEKIGIDFPSPLRGRMANQAHAAWNVTEQIELYGRYLSSEKEYPGSGSVETSFSRSRGRTGGRYRMQLREVRVRVGAGFERTTQKSVSAVSTTGSVSQALRLEGTVGFRAFGFNSVALLGKLNDDWIGEVRSFQDITVQVSYQPSAAHGYNAFVHYYDGARMYALSNFRMVTANFSGFYRPDRRWMIRLRSSLGLNKIVVWHRGYVLRGDVEHRLPNGHEVEVSVLGQKNQEAGLSRALFKLAYAIPLQIPITRSRVGGRLVGSVVDADREGVKNVRVFLGDRVALTDNGGHFEFAGLDSGSYRLEVSRGDLGLDVVPVDPLPKLVHVNAPEQQSIQIGVTAAAELSGTVNLFAHDTEGQLSASRELIPKGGLRNVIVELVRDSVRYQQVTNRLGEFLFAGLAPGQWTLRILAGTIPSEHDATPETASLELEPGKREQVEVHVEPRVRRIRFIQPHDATGSSPMRPAEEGTAQDHPTDKKSQRQQDDG